MIAVGVRRRGVLVDVDMVFYIDISDFIHLHSYMSYIFIFIGIIHFIHSHYQFS